MKKILIMFMALVWTAALMAQKIAVVDANGSTQVYMTFQEAVKGAADNSVIYLPGGGHTIADSVKITKKLTILGIGHKSNTDNVDGVTKISGNLFFSEGSSGSSVIGCYVTGNVDIANDGSSINNVLIRYCNLNSVIVRNPTCIGTVVNQNYLRDEIDCNKASAEITNNVCYYIEDLDGGVISNNIITLIPKSGNIRRPIWFVTNSFITGNIILNNSSIDSYVSCSNNSCNGNLGWKSPASNDEDYINLNGINQSGVFVNYNGGAVSPVSDFHFKDDYKQYESQVGIYAGTGFHDDQLAPVPYIVSKNIDEQTDAAGNLKVRIRVKAGEQE